MANVHTIYLLVTPKTMNMQEAYSTSHVKVGVCIY